MRCTATRKDVAQFSKGVERQLDLEAFHAFLSDGDYIKLGMIRVKKGDRRSGIGSRAMRALTDFADDHTCRIVLNPATKGDPGGPTSRTRLIKFYKRFGFKHNKGRNKDYALPVGMYREPWGG